ncbi:DUF4595 domain-containing protein [Lacibacter sediminis]|uniref:DUF4595 domain-containing protein n=1 Tax=Lacibacter sediminis TaxID=2760713 RepID=A0A7G5XIG3_9BACT|nr:DUF4595 domain-containing protein [Lacibacter sediminis]QNA45266.1 DUF4595 domain-containing protein [Lacibacter sediminis]
MKQLMFAFVAMLVFAGCKKEKVPKAENLVKKGKLSEFSYSFNGSPAEICKISYDNSGRLATYMDSDHKYSFSYNGASNLVVTRSKLSDGTIDQTIECVLNGSGAITKAEYKSNGLTSYTYLFNYDASGNMLSLKGSGGGGTHEEVFTYENGVPVSLKVSDGVSVYRTEQFVYDFSRVNKSGLTYWYIWPSDVLYGKPLKYHLKEVKSFNANGDVINHTKYNLNFDAEGYPVSEVVSSQIKNYIQTYTYKF